MSKIKEIIAREILDSRGKPTVEVELHVGNDVFIDSCPSGTSSGANEALELRDEDGRSVKKVVDNVNNIIAKALVGMDPLEQKAIDEVMIKLDGTKNKSKLGANAILPVSMAVARAGAAVNKIPLYQHISNISGNNLNMPLPSFNIINGGAHAKNQLDVQEFMVMPQKKTFTENLIIGSKVFEKLTQIIKESFGELPEMGFEGGYAPMISKAEQALYMLKNAIGDFDAKIAIDVAATELYKDGKYILEGREFSRQELIDFYKDLVSRFPIISIEDAFSEEDWEGFKEIKQELKDTIIIGDDLTTTNIKRIKEAESKKACNGIIIKLNQIGSVSETIEAVNMAKSYGWKIMVSHRSGETLDNFIADLAVGVGADFIKSGAYTREERVVKYNRLLEIEQELKTSN
ncbi:MAG: phosphopyruvate hydratase [Candidatus Staskawiczbacteria bacterium RIFCSPHIGHO2_01_FULL_34_27]|uniref:Enolase n=2 Tax=Candidatus Staskawicziibacteriota TaxID=1817916 RepID=A0A1G2HJT0_9BACT|nr:MAG: phosphopyruvate hydratase [Candidatus Staskawiczbacteria bacterium RIFCSPHIGHO2_01_FULL_34_27]OGZ69536.1 MAG: phosphopyruvate hydratase [Candidatus Staskawiczbacteria bacterium RIFCSPHIGHO2_02_FULL_34_9]